MSDSGKNALLAENRSLKAQVAYLEEILNKAPVYLYINEIDNIDDISVGRNIWSNERALDFIGYTQEEMEKMGNNCFINLVHPDDFELAEKTLELQKRQSDEQTYVRLYRVKNKNNEYTWTNGRTYILKRKPDGTPCQFLNAAFDLSDQLQAEWQLRETLKVINRLKKHRQIEKISKRELEVLELIVTGLTDGEIANVLFISERTAQTHRNRLLKKTGTRNTATLVVFAMECGLYS